jgi:hypothetical protein
MTTESLDYKGRKVAIQLLEAKNGKWTWAYEIDGTQYTENRDHHLRSKVAALMEASQEARHRIDSTI